jgi:hypothetical protein
MSVKKETYIRVDEDLYEELKRIAGIEKRSINAQIEYFLQKSADRYNNKTQRESDNDKAQGR